MAAVAISNCAGSIRRTASPGHSAWAGPNTRIKAAIASPAPDDQLLALNDALDRFAALEPQQAELVELRYFVGLKIEEAAEILGISEATAKRWWAYARAWLFEQIRPASSSDE